MTYVKGFLTPLQYKKIKERQINSKLREDLINKKDGKLTRVLPQIVDDLDLILNTDDIKYLSYDIGISLSLKKLEYVLEKFFDLSIPFWRIIVVTKPDKKRVFKLGTFNPEQISDIESFTNSNYFSGLLKNERILIKKYITKYGFEFPLEYEIKTREVRRYYNVDTKDNTILSKLQSNTHKFTKEKFDKVTESFLVGKEYSWNELKSILQNKMQDSINKKELQSNNNKVRNRKIKARKLLDEKLGIEFSKKLLQETGCSFKIIYEGDPKDFGFKP